MRVTSGRMALNDTERRRIAKAIWRYTGLAQPVFAKRVGIDYNALRAALNDRAKAPPSTDDLLKMTDAFDLPEAIAVHGWHAADRVAHLEGKVAELEQRLDAIDAPGDEALTHAFDALAQELLAGAQELPPALAAAIERAAARGRRLGGLGGGSA